MFFFYVLFKWLMWFCMPYTWVMLGLFVLAGFACWRRRWLRAAVQAVLGLILLITGLPVVSTAMGYALECRCPAVFLQDIPQADAIVVLGGGIGRMGPGMPYPECYPASDRAVMAARLYHAGKAPLILPSGSGSSLGEKPFFEAMNIPPSAILCEDRSLDTAGNARSTLALLRKHGCQKILLVTSSWHMPRARMLFCDDTLDIVPVGCDYEATLAKGRQATEPIWTKLPTAQAAGQFGVYLKEYLGIVFYTLRRPSAD